MNLVECIGRLVRDPETKLGSDVKTSVARFTIAIDRGKNKAGEDLGADYPQITCFGKTAENVERYCYKGMLVGIIGKIRTGSYEKNGEKIYKTEIYAERVEFLENNKDKAQDRDNRKLADEINNSVPEPESNIPAGFTKMDESSDDIPF